MLAQRETDFIYDDCPVKSLKTVSIKRLLFQSDSMELQNIQQRIDILNLLIFLISEAIETVVAYQEDKYHHFDAQVGENLCQVRSCFLFDIFSDSYIKQKKNITLLLKEFKQYHQSISELRNQNHLRSKTIDAESLKYVRSCRKPVMLCDFINNDLDFKIPYFLLVLIQCFFLRKYATLSPEFSIASQSNGKWVSRADIGGICRNSGLSKRTAKRIIHHYQKTISQVSCDYVQYLMFKKNINHRFMIDILKKETDENRQVFPYYEVMRVLLNHMIFEEIPVVFRVKRFSKFQSDISTLLFCVDKSSFSYKLADKQKMQLYKNSICIMMDSRSEFQAEKLESRYIFLSKLLSIGIEKIIMLNAAAHPQYSGSMLDKYKENPYLDFFLNGVSQLHKKTIIADIERKRNELFRMRGLAANYGYSEENRHNGVIKHILCESTNRHVYNNIELFPLLYDASILT